jgi:hypothetical protein
MIKILVLALMILLYDIALAEYGDYVHTIKASTISIPFDGNYEVNNMTIPQDIKKLFLSKAGELVAKRNRVKIDDVLEFLTHSVEKNKLMGVGKTPVTVAGKLRAFKNLITTAKSLIEIGDIAGACQQLKEAHKKSDGETTNYDLVTGPAAPKLNQMIKSLMNDLRCQ